MFKKILVPLDGSKTAELLLNYITQVAKKMEASVQVLTVLTPDMAGPASYPGSLHEGIFRESLVTRAPSLNIPTSNAEVSDEQRSSTQRFLDAQVARLQQEGVQASALMTEGLAEEQIIEVADQHDCDLIAMSTRGSNTAEKGLVGSVTLKVLHATHIPLLLIDPDRAATYTEALDDLHVVVPLDGSSFGEMALPYAEELSQQMGAPISLVHAVRSVNPALLADPMTGGLPSAEALEAFSEDASEYMNGLVETLKAEGVNASAEILKGKADKCIVEFCKPLKQSITVMTTHGHGAMARWLLGSVTQGVVRTCEDAVLVIPRQYGKQQASEITHLLEQASIFSNLSEEALQHIAEAARVQQFEAGEMIVEEGEETGGCFIITEGSVEVLKSGQVVDEMGKGTFFGEMSILENIPRSASIRAKEPVSCVSIRRTDFAELLQRRPMIAVGMLPELAKRLREAREQQVN